MTRHPARWKSHGEQPLTGYGHTRRNEGQAAARRGERITKESMTSKRRPATNQAGEGTRTCLRTSTHDAWHQIA
jgi:hypothetical protein